MDAFILVCIEEGISVRKRLPNKIRRYTSPNMSDDGITRRFVLNGLVSQGFSASDNTWFHYPQLVVLKTDGSLANTVSRCWSERH